MEVPTPIAIKRKASQKKSQETEAKVDASIISKITKSAKKGKKAQTAEEKSEGETNYEEDKKLRLQKRTIMEGRLF